jgi:hypothetical protein
MKTAVLALALCVRPLLALQEDDGMSFFEKRIRPVLAEHCYSCHSEKADKLKGGLLLDTKAGVLKGGDTGPAVIPGHPEKSLLLKALRGTDADMQMPPKKKLSDEVVRDFEAWIVRGAPDPRHSDVGGARKGKIDWDEARRYWAFQPLREPKLPEVRDASWPASPIDRFILARLEAKGLRPAPDADPRTLLRRVTFDLTGLPPTPEELDAFLADPSPAAFARVVDRLLASPAYGERWGRHWLDVVRYADTAGDNSDFPVPQHHRYRDYVIRAFNEDVPFDRFVREQIAGDLLPAKTEEERVRNIVATGYLANARRFGSRVDDYPWHLTIEDTIDNLGRTFLGFTVNCTRCHDHKFDPFTNDDYYALYGIFSSTRYPWPGIELEQKQRDFVPLVPADQAARALAGRAARQKELDEDFKRIEAEKKAVDAAATGDDAESARLKEFAAELAKALDAAKKARDQHGKAPLPFETAYAVAEAPKAGNAKIQVKGDPERLGIEVPRRFPTILGGRSLGEGTKGSGRLELAEWIVDPSNPLTARVTANRIWHWHFGKGIVATPSDFGKQGRAPTHPELLDWLARRFQESGGSWKAMHRLVCLSRAYRMSSRDDAEALVADPANELLWKFSRRRLEAEAIRDAILSVSGGLDRSPAPPHPFPPMPQWDFTQHKPFVAVYESERRSVYLMTQRIRRHPFFGTFDGADPSASTASRPASTTTLQALYFLNDPFVHAQAKRFAERLAAERPVPETRVERAWQFALGRPPTSDERASALAHVGRAGAEGWESLARVLFRLNEFLYLR